MRRLPVYILIDTSGSMKGEPIESVEQAVNKLIDLLRNDPWALECVALSILTFDKDAKCLIPLTTIENIKVPNLDCSNIQEANLKAAIALLHTQITTETKRSTPQKKGDWLPCLFLFTDGEGLYGDQNLEELIASLNKLKFTIKVVLSSHETSDLLKEKLKTLTNYIFTITGVSLERFIWPEPDFLGLESNNLPDIELPPPPENVNIIL